MLSFKQVGEEPEPCAYGARDQIPPNGLKDVSSISLIKN